MTHVEFAQAVMKEWHITPAELRQSCYSQWYNYKAEVDGKLKLIGKYTLVDSKPTFVIIKKNGTEENHSTKE